MQSADDAMAIRDVIDRYAVGVDRRDWSLVGTCFTADCVADYGRSGRWSDREAFVAGLDQMHRDIGPTMHRMTNHLIEFDGGSARATSYLDAYLRVEHRGFDLLHVLATYDDRLVRVGEEWAICARTVDNYLWRREHSSS